MVVHLDLELPQVKQLVDQLDQKDKAELARYLDSQTIYEEFQNFITAKSEVDLTYDQITQEVQAARKQKA